MRRRSVMLAAGWAAVTIVATLVAWQGVSLVADEVTETRPASLSDDEVTQAASEQPTSTSTAAPATTGAPTGDPPATQPGSAPASPPQTGPPPTAAPATTAAPPPPPAAQDETRTYDLVGGTVVVHFHGNGTVSIVSSQPKPGFERELHAAGPEKVDVEFESEGHKSRLVARWEAGTPTGEVDEEADGDGGDD